MKSGKTSFGIQRFEFLERQLAYLSIEYGYQIFFAINSFIFVVFSYLGIRKYSTNIGLSLLTFISIPTLYFLSMSTVRFHSALAIMFFAYQYAEKRKYGIFLFWLAIAFLMHKSSILTILLIPLTRINLKRKSLIVIYVASFTGSLIIQSILSFLSQGENSLVVTFIEYSKREGGNSFSKLPYLYHIVNILLLLFYNKIVEKDKIVSGYMVTTYSIGCSIMQFLIFQNIISYRLSSYFVIFIIVLLPVLILNNRWKKINSILIYSILLVLFFYSFYLTTLINDISPYLPYQTIF